MGESKGIHPGDTIWLGEAKPILAMLRMESIPMSLTLIALLYPEIYFPAPTECSPMLRTGFYRNYYE